VHVNKIECVQMKFIRYALRGLGWMDMDNLLSYVDRGALIHLEILCSRRANSCVMFIFDLQDRLEG
jgi:hypothetical protein